MIPRMSGARSTCWELIRGAAAGDAACCETFAHEYEAPVRAFFAARWRAAQRAQEVDDAVQQVFLECFKERGALAKADAQHASGFRALLYSVARNVALRFESARAVPGAGVEPDLLPADEVTLSRAFDRAFALMVVREAAGRMREKARLLGDPEAWRRVEMLRLHFEQNQKISAIAESWGVEAKILYRHFEKARAEFEGALLETVALHHRGPPAELRREAAQLASLLA
jgi:RNA polymerase sigma-70 factor (ECF subfamily)